MSTYSKWTLNFFPTFHIAQLKSVSEQNSNRPSGLCGTMGLHSILIKSDTFQPFDNPYLSRTPLEHNTKLRYDMKQITVICHKSTQWEKLTCFSLRAVILVCLSCSCFLSSPSYNWTKHIQCNENDTPQILCITSSIMEKKLELIALRFSCKVTLRTKQWNLRWVNGEREREGKR